MCVFCQEFNEGSDRIIWEDDDWVVIPGRGAFVEGYCLLLPRTCCSAFSRLEATESSSVDKVAEAVRGAIEKCFGPTAIAEHGVGKTPGDLGSCCCADHAHLHFLPVPKPEDMVQEYQLVGGNPVVIPSLAALGTYDASYLFLSPAPHIYLVWPWEKGFLKQFARRVAAAQWGETRWNWQRDTFEGNMQRTLEILHTIPRPWCGRNPD